MSSENSPHTNRLAAETSPYLLQHAHNPVDWYPWGPEALLRAREEDRPILLSVGYSACHWCHVMERESFENADIAALMNKDYVCIKVDREERPDIDAIYMNAVQLMTGQGGWPMTVFLTPAGKPFYGGTYYPPVDTYGRPGFPRVLEAVAKAWRVQRKELDRQAADMIATLDGPGQFTSLEMPMMLVPDVLDKALGELSKMFDRTNGGFGTAPKFPQPCVLDFLLRIHTRFKRSAPLEMAEMTLQKMALGGMYDQLGGGFHRYSTDALWLAPHFEKMLYDNAQLVQTYCRAYQITGRQFYRDVAEETLEYVLREMTDPETGAFYSAQDADSEGEEGKFFVWTPADLEAELGARDAAIFAAFYDVSDGGNWEGKSILRVVKDARQVADQFDIPVQEAGAILDGARAKLLAAREARVKPALDDKCLTSWNALMLAAFAECGAAFDRPDFVSAAERNAKFLLGTMAVRKDGHLRLMRTYRKGEAKLNAYLEDYAFLADALLLLHRATGGPEWLIAADDLMYAMAAHFQDPDDFSFFSTSDDHEALVLRLKDNDDNAIPSGNTVALEVMLRIAALRGDRGMRDMVGTVLRRAAPLLEKHPYGFGRLLGVLDTYLSDAVEIVICPGETGLVEMRNAINHRYLPNALIIYHIGTDAGRFPIFESRGPVDGATAAYVCRNSTCALPVVEAAEIRIM